MVWSDFRIRNEMSPDYGKERVLSNPALVQNQYCFPIKETEIMLRFSSISLGL
jgi:hypothetical protein